MLRRRRTSDVVSFVLFVSFFFFLCEKAEKIDGINLRSIWRSPNLDWCDLNYFCDIF